MTTLSEDAESGVRLASASTGGPGAESRDRSYPDRPDLTLSPGLTAHAARHIGVLDLPMRSRYVLQLQRRYGNRHVQTLLNRSLHSVSAPRLQCRTVCPPGVSEEDGTGCYEVADDDQSTAPATDQAPVDQAPVDQTLVNQTPANQNPADQPPADQPLADQGVSDGASADQTSSDPASVSVAAAVPGDALTPPGDCTEAENKALHDEVHRLCHGQQGCKGTDSCPEIWNKIQQFADCIKARTITNAKCYRGGNTGHIIALAAAVGALNNCWAMHASKRCNPDKHADPVPVPKPSRSTILKVLIALGLSIALVATIIAALADPEPATKLGLAGLTVAEIEALGAALGFATAVAP